MRSFPAAVALACIVLVCVAFGGGFGLGLASHAEDLKTFPLSGFSFELECSVPGTPEQVFDLFTGDVSPWWDHHFAEKPLKLYIEPKAGGGFYEIFDAQGNGVQHALVTCADRGKELDFRGPLGFGRMGVHLDFVHRVTFAADGENTRIHLTVHGAGEMEKDWPASVEKVWEHFLIERFQSYATRKLGG